MQELEEFELEMYAEAYRGRRWIFMPRCEGERYALAISVVGEPGKVNIPVDLCNAGDFDAIKAYAQRLNDRREKVASAA
jgi:hypothetical protein